MNILDCGHQVQDTRGEIIVFNESEKGYITVCANCLPILGTCGACEKVRECLFETSSVPEPKVIVKTIQNGNMQMQTQIKNPDRIAKTCVNCICWNKEENYCMREIDRVCGQYTSVFQKAGYEEGKGEESATN
jgi:hypothetical protein